MPFAAPVRPARASGHLEPGRDAGGVVLGHGRADRPAAGIVGDEGDARHGVGREVERIEEIGVPAVVEWMEQAEGVAVDSQGVIYGAEVGPRKLQRYVKK